MPSPPSLGGAGLSEVAQSLRLYWRRVHLAVRRCSQRPYIDRLALDFRQCSFRHITRVSLSNGFSVFSPFSALSACSCPLALSGSGEPLTQGYSSESFPSAMGMLHELLRRTGGWRQSAARLCSARGRAQELGLARPLTRLLPSLWYAYAASFEGTCFKYARISAFIRSISAR